MRLHEVERGDTLGHRTLFKLVSAVSKVRFPDAARVALYHQDFVSRLLATWTQDTMRGPSGWSVGERELMAAMVGSWNHSAFCLPAHRSTAIQGLPVAVVDACIRDYRTAPIGDRLRSTLGFLERMTIDPDQLTVDDAQQAIDAGASRDDLADAAAVAALFNIVNRYADALGFDVPTPDEFARLAPTLWKRGYR